MSRLVRIRYREARMESRAILQRARRALRVGLRHAHGQALFAVGRARGLAYRLAGREPDPWVGDDVLGDRLRSSLGRLEKRLDVPHVHVTVERHIAILHGEVGTEADATAIEDAARRVSGVRGIESYLCVGLLDGDTRPSESTTSVPRL